MHPTINSFDQTSKTGHEFLLKNIPYQYMQIDTGSVECTITDSLGNRNFLLAHTACQLHKRYIHRQGCVSSQL